MIPTLIYCAYAYALGCLTPVVIVYLVCVYMRGKGGVL